MPKKEHFLATGAGLLFIGAIVVMIVFIVLWSRCKDKKCEKCLPKDCSGEMKRVCMGMCKNAGHKEDWCNDTMCKWKNIKGYL